MKEKEEERKEEAKSFFFFEKWGEIFHSIKCDDTRRGLMKIEKLPGFKVLDPRKPGKESLGIFKTVI